MQKRSSRVVSYIISYCVAALIFVSSASICAPRRAHLERLARDRVGAHDGRGAGAGVLLHAPRERRAHAVDHAVGRRRRDDLAAQPVLAQILAEALLHAARGK